MTIRGIIITFLEAVLLVIALGTGIRELYILAAGFAIVIIFSLLSVLTAVVSLKAKAKLDTDSIERKKDLTYTLSLSGFILLPIMGYVHILPPGYDKFSLSLRKYHSFLLTIGLKPRRYEFILPAIHKGYWQISPEKLFIKDLFGLFSLPIFRNSAATVSVEVLPKKYISESDDETVPTANGFAMAQINSAENGESVGDSRIYRSGDPLKRINWKQSARVRELFTRMYEEQENPQILIIVDGECDCAMLNDNCDILCETTMSILDFYLRIGKDTRVAIYRTDTGFYEKEARVGSMEEFYIAQRMLTELTLEKSKEPFDLSHIKDGNTWFASTVHVISSNPSEELLDKVNSLYSIGAKVSVISPRMGGTEDLTNALKYGLGEIKPVILENSDEIPEKVGGLL